MRLDTRSAALARPIVLALVTPLALMAGTAAARQQGPQDPVAAARAELEKTIRPPAAQEGDGPELAEVKAAIQRILAANDPDTSRVRIFGSQGAAALRSIIEDVGLQTVALDFPLNPLPILMEQFPANAVDYLVELERADAPLFDIYVRSGFGPGRLLRNGGTEGAARTALVGLFDRTLQRPTLSTGERLDLALDALGAGIETPASQALIAANLQMAVAKDNRRTRLRLIPFIRSAHGGDPAAMPSGLAFHLLKYGGTDEALLRSLLESSDRWVRFQVIETVASSLSSGELAPAAAVEILLPLIADPDPVVARSAYLKLAQELKSYPALVDMDQLEAVARAAASGVTMEPYVAQVISDAIRFRLQNLTRDEHERTVRLIRRFFGAEQPALHQELRQDLWQGQRLTPEGVLVALEVLLDVEGVEASQLKRLASTVVGNRAETAEEAAFTVRMLELLADHPSLAGSLQSFSLEAVGPDMRPRALAWMGTSDERRNQDLMEAVVKWEDTEATFRASAFDDARPWRERVIALTGLFLSERTTPEDAERAAVVLRSAVLDDERREAFVRIFFEGINRRSDGASPHWADVVAALYADESIPTGSLSWVRLLRPARTEREARAIARVVDAVDQRRQLGPVNSTMRTVARYCLETGLDPARGADVLEGHGELVVGWAGTRITGWSGVERECVSYALARQPGIVEDLLPALTGNLMEAESDWGWKAVVDQILRLPSERAVPALLAATQRIGKPDLVKYVDERVGELVRIREIEERWGSLAGRGATTEGAKAQVLRMLEDEREVVRVEAIRSLATLGAVEALPQLIETVASGSDKESAAARIALDQLHRQAAKAREAEDQK